MFAASRRPADTARLLLAVVATGALASCAVARTWDPDSFPNPQKDMRLCGRRGVPSFICDPDGVLSYDGANLVEGLIKQLQRGEDPYAKGPCGTLGTMGFQVAVALMRHLRLGMAHDMTEAAADFARELHASWGVGSAACNNGVLLLLATGDRQVYISTGSGSEPRLPRSTLLAIMGNMRPALREQRYDDAVLEAVHEIGLALAGKPVPGRGGGGQPAEGGGAGPFLFFCSIVVAVFGWGWYSNRRQMRRYKSCQDRLEAIKRDQAAARRGQYASTSCPVCLEDFDDTQEAGPSDGGAGAALAERAGSVGASTSAAGVGGMGRNGGAEPTGESAPLLSSRDDAAAATAATGSRARRPLALRCGHTFCAPCITEWVRNHTTCPVCRRHIDSGDSEPAAPGAAGRPPCSAGVSAATAAAAAYPPMYPYHGGGMAQRDLWLPELQFRTRRLRALYPDFVSDLAVAQFLQDLQDDRDLSPAALSMLDTRHPARDAQRRTELRAEGRMGATTSFGGGTGDGGGAGSSW